MKSYFSALFLLACPWLLQAADRETFEATRVVVQERTVTRTVPANAKVPAKVIRHFECKELTIPNGARVTRLKIGENKLVLTARKSFFKPTRAFYLPPEAAAVAQLIVETKGRETYYILKGRAPGVSIGGEVRRSWLDDSGLRPRSEADTARIQQQVNAAPLYIEVQ